MTDEELIARDLALARDVRGLMASGLGDLTGEFAFASAMSVLGMVSADIIRSLNASPLMREVGVQMAARQMREWLAEGAVL